MHKTSLDTAQSIGLLDDPLALTVCRVQHKNSEPKQMMLNQVVHFGSNQRATGEYCMGLVNQHLADIS
jgi:hypothetical protein